MTTIIASSTTDSYIEGKADIGGLQPGRFVRLKWTVTDGTLEYDGGGVDNALSATCMIVLENFIIGKDHTVNYSAGDVTMTKVLQPGDIVHARTQGSQTIGLRLGVNTATKNGILLVNAGQPEYAIAEIMEPGIDQGDGTYLTKVHIL